jgi:hypothetical protein
MRKLGFILLALGFLWASLLELERFMRGGLRPLVLGQYAELSSDASHAYSREDVQLRIRETAISAYRMRPHPIVPGILMLTGGLLLARSGRAKAGDNAA